MQFIFGQRLSRGCALLRLLISSMFSKIYQGKLPWIALLFLFVIPIFLSTYKLSESPPVWYDEGVFTQVAINMARDHGYHLQVAPDEFVSAESSTTGLTVLYPISLVFKYFGITIVNARIVMVLFILFTVIAVFLFLKKAGGPRVALYGILLLVSFAPLYGHGKSVLGEVPGMFFLFCFLYFLYHLEQSQKPNGALYILAGFFAGLCVITKPFFLILIPIIIVMGIIFRKVILRTRGGYLLFVVAFIIPFFVWVFIQFGGPSSINVLAHYSNPNSVNVWQAFHQNIWRFFSEPQPAYFLILLATWICSLFLRIRNRQLPSMAESVAISFSLVTLVVFLRTSGYYRYFFPGQTMAIVFFPYAVFNLVGILSRQLGKIKVLLYYTAQIFLISLFAFQFYQTSFHSWVSMYYGSINSARLENYFKNFNIKKSIFLYNVPEVVVFLPQDVAYFQYLKITGDIVIGKEQLSQIARGFPDQIIMTNLFWSEHQNQFENYNVTSTGLDRYEVLERTKRD